MLAGLMIEPRCKTPDKSNPPPPLRRYSLWTAPKFKYCMTLQKEQKNVPGILLADDIKACFMLLAGLMIEPRCKTSDKSNWQF